MNFSSIDEIRACGFEGFKTISALQASDCCEVPELPGVYVVLRPAKDPPSFLSVSKGGHFKGKDPTVEKPVLEAKWERVPGALVLYIGKAGPGKTANLRDRLRNYMHFGQGKPVAKFGGRYIWQMHDSGDLLISWKPTPGAAPREIEKTLIREFEEVYGSLPFANLCH